MTRDEVLTAEEVEGKNKLKREAEEKAKKRTKGFKCQDNCEKSYVMGALDFAEPREKQIQIDAEQIRALQKQNGELTDRVKELEEKLKKETAQRIYNFNKSIEWKEKHRELEAQNEKMKCCETCRYYDYHEIGTGNKDCILWYRDKVFCEHKNMWELRR